jgi:hypothetical protein
MRKMLKQVKIVRLLCIYRIIINLCIFKGVENIVNKYAFDKSKLSSLFVFESSFSVYVLNLNFFSYLKASLLMKDQIWSAYSHKFKMEVMLTNL